MPPKRKRTTTSTTAKTATRRKSTLGAQQGQQTTTAKRGSKSTRGRSRSKSPRKVRSQREQDINACHCALQNFYNVEGIEGIYGQFGFQAPPNVEKSRSRSKSLGVKRSPYAICASSLGPEKTDLYGGRKVDFKKIDCDYSKDLLRHAGQDMLLAYVFGQIKLEREKKGANKKTPYEDAFSEEKFFALPTEEERTLYLADIITKVRNSQRRARRTGTGGEIRKVKVVARPKDINRAAKRGSSFITEQIERRRRSVSATRSAITPTQTFQTFTAASKSRKGKSRQGTRKATTATTTTAKQASRRKSTAGQQQQPARKRGRPRKATTGQTATGRKATTKSTIRKATGKRRRSTRNK